MTMPRVDTKAVAIVENMIEHVLAQPSMYGNPSDVESTALTLADLWEQFHANDADHQGELWVKNAGRWRDLWHRQIRLLHGDTNVLRLSDPVNATVSQSGLMEQVVTCMKNIFDALFASYRGTEE